MNKVTKVSAVWCGPCKQYAPIFESVTKDLENWDILSLDVDTDEGKKFAEKHGLRGVPATVFEREGEEPTVLMGSKSSVELLKLFE
jgi:thioredoxin 1